MKTSASVGGVDGGGRRGWKRSREREGGGIHANISFVAPTRLAATIFLVFLHPNLSSIPFFPENSLFTGKKPHYRKVWRPVFPLAVRLPFISRDKMIVMLTQREERGEKISRASLYHRQQDDSWQRNFATSLSFVVYRYWGTVAVFFFK